MPRSATRARYCHVDQVLNLVGEPVNLGRARKGEPKVLAHQVANPVGATKLLLVTPLGSARSPRHPVRFPYSRSFPHPFPANSQKPTPTRSRRRVRGPNSLAHYASDEVNPEGQVVRFR